MKICTPIIEEYETKKEAPDKHNYDNKEIIDNNVEIKSSFEAQLILDFCNIFNKHF